MEIFNFEKFIKMEIPTPGTYFRQDILTEEQKAKKLGGMFFVIRPGHQVPLHYHTERETLIICLSGEMTEIIEGKEVHLKPNDVMFILPGEKHTTVNRTDKECRYLAYYSPPVFSDITEVK